MSDRISIVPTAVEISRAVKVPEQPDLYILQVKGPEFGSGGSETIVNMIWDRDVLLDTLSEVGKALNELSGGEDG